MKSSPVSSFIRNCHSHIQHTLIHTLTYIHTHTHSCTQTHTHTLTRTHTHTFTHTYSHTHTLTHTHSLSLSHTHTHTHEGRSSVDIFPNQTWTHLNTTWTQPNTATQNCRTFCSVPAFNLQIIRAQTTLDIHYTYLDNKEKYRVLKTRCIIFVSFSTKFHLFRSFIFFPAQIAHFS